MIEYFLNTGICSTGEDFNKFGQITNGIGSIPNNNILANDISVNGQTLLETLPTVSVVAQREIISNSGDFFLSGNFLRDTTGFLNLNYSQRTLQFDITKSGDRTYYFSENHNDLITGFSGILGSSLSGDYVFLNGDKLSSGESYVENSNGDFEWIDDDSNITGLLFSMPRRDFYFQSGSYDVFRVKHNKGSSIGYLNGVKIQKGDYLELASVIYPKIETGLEPSIEFSSNQSSLSINF